MHKVIYGCNIGPEDISRTLSPTSSRLCTSEDDYLYGGYSFHSQKISVLVEVSEIASVLDENVS